MNVKLANLLVESVQDRIRTEQYCKERNREELNAYKVVFENKAATEDDKKKADELEKKIGELEKKIGEHFENINMLEDFIDALTTKEWTFTL